MTAAGIYRGRAIGAPGEQPASVRDHLGQRLRHVDGKAMPAGPACSTRRCAGLRQA
jgi:hypothetical protein